MAYVNVAEWKPDQVTDWLKGLDSVIVPYIHSFLNNQVNGQQLLNLGPDDLEHFGVFKLGHQELILEAVELLRNFHYELDRETLQMLALRLSCLAHSLHNELSHNHMDATLVSTQTLADVANIAAAVQPLAGWLDRPPFSGQLDYCSRKSELLSLALEMATSAQRDRFAERPVEELRVNSSKMAVLADSIIRDIQDPLLLQPASLELVTLKKRSSDDLGFYIVPSFYGVHQIGALKLNSAAHQSGKLEPGDEIVQINYQTVVGWQVKQVMALFEESPTEVLLTIKKRPRHTKVYGQIYMKPYRLPSRKRAVQNSFARWTENLPSPRPELFTIPQIQLPIAKSVSVESTVSAGQLPSSSEEEGEGLEGDGASSPTSARLYLPKPRLPVQRRATITGASPLSKRAPVNLQQFWEELKLEREWRGMGGGGEKPKVAQLIQDCESRVSGPRKYSSFDNLKDRNTGYFLKDSKPDVVSSCQDRLKSAGSDDTFKTAETSEGKSSCSDVTTLDSARRLSVGSEEGKSDAPEITGSDDVFKVVDSYGRSSKKSTELTETFKDENDRLLPNQPTHVRDKSDDSDSVFVSDSDTLSEISEGKVSSLKAKIEMFSKACSESDKPKPPVNRGMKPKVPLRTFRLPVAPEKQILPKVEVKVVSSELTEAKADEPTLTVPKEKSPRERGKLDKSFSTPAYDFSPDLSVSEKISMLKQKFLADSKIETKSDSAFEDSKSDVESLSGRDEETKTNDNSISTSIPSISEELADSEKEVHGQIVETINKHLLTLDYETDSEPKWKDKNTTANLDSEKVIETEEKIGKILETLNSSVIERRKEMERDAKVRKNSTEGADLSKTISQVCKEEILQTYNPSGFVLTKPTSLENIAELKPKSGIIPIPPRVRITPPTIHEEKPSLPDVTMISPVPPETPRRKPLSNLDCVDKPVVVQAPATFPRQKAESRRPITPPEPPPRPTPPAPAVQPKGACYRAMMVAKSISKTAKVSSPRSLRKKNPLLAKHRNVTLKELGVCECEGWLQQRCRRGSGQWNRGWFVIKNTTFYGFKHKEAHKADVMISLPGFTVSDAEEVKSRKFAFKVYHTGTMFYFAAENQEELSLWMDCITVATRPTHETYSTSPLFSESEGEGSGEEGGSGSCFSSPKMKKLAGLLGSPSKQAGSSSSTNTLDKNNESGKKQFGSLKKQRGGTSEGADAGGSSLDRKYLGFLGRGTAVPVPTAQFRSYRRVAPPLPRSHHQSAESVLTLDTSMGSFSEMSQRSPRGAPQVSPGLPTSQPLPPDMADYRLASLAKNRRRDNQEQDTSGFVTLEALMLSRQEEERRNQQNLLLNQPPPPPVSPRVRPTPQETNPRPRVAPRVVTPSPAPLSQSRPSHSRSTSAFTEERDRESNSVTVVRRSSFNTPSRLQRHMDLDNQDYRDGSPEKLWIDSLRRTDRRYPPTPRHIHQVHPAPTPAVGTRLKKAALYQPPPVSPLDTPGGEGMQLAFEMTLDQSEAKRRYQKVGPTPATRLKNLFSGRSENNPTQKTLLGSPRLHRAIFRGSMTRADSSGETVISPPLSPPQDVMEIQVTNPTAPDYPGLEYPPVFEPGTYSLADASSVLRHRNREAR
ncbi:uncharacterized protein LOC128987620 isoform X2 [Macrosteles quadrilineatus]|uniref:uncharacterized protein LOC128987620 isoform X2 n=1 Tax=Macrosteles quadrilineatus TaxID=74068 RepID=UPI0023E0BEA4|nr:uncharacterized protein LOC128987620 isoform X2 [Macrosteles quadrilineatus]